MKQNKNEEAFTNQQLWIITDFWRQKEKLDSFSEEEEETNGWEPGREDAILSWSPEEDKLFTANPSPARYRIWSLSFTPFFSPTIFPPRTSLPVFVTSLEVAGL